MTWTHRCMIVTASYAPLARALALGIAGESGSNMWITPLSTTGTVTHYISTGSIQSEFAALMPLWEASQVGGVWSLTQVSAGQPEAVVAASEGSVTLAQVIGLFANCDITEQEPYAAMSRLGLQMV